MLLATAQIAAAQDEAAPEPEPLYQVEVLVFRYVDQTRNTPEIPRLVEPEINDVLDQQLARLSVDPPPLSSVDELLQGLPETVPPPFWSPADPAAGSLIRDAATLRRLGAYEVLGHLAWVQPAEDVSVAEAIEVTELGSMGFDGSVKLYRKRYLHLAVDLELEPGDSMSFDLLPGNEARPAIVDSRRMRLGRTIYFDQPQFGVLATVNRLEEADAG